MTLNRSFPTQHPSGLPITDTRRVMAGLVARNADGTPRAGVFPANTSPLVTGRATAPLMAYDVAPFLAATSRINTGVELIANDASTTVATTAAPASNSRIDVIWVRSQFVQHADANNDVVFGVTQGTAALTPTKPAIPAGALELATAEILSTTTQTSTAVITQTAPFTAPSGAPVWMRSATDMNAWAPANGAQVFRLDTGDFYQRRGGAWEIAGGDTGWLPLTLGPGWNAVSGHTPRGRRINGVVHSEGAVIRASGGLHTNIAILPAVLRIIGPGKTTFIGPTVAGKTGGVSYQEMYTDTSGVIGVSGYTSMDGTIDWVLPLTSTFVQDQR